MLLQCYVDIKYVCFERMIALSYKVWLLLTRINLSTGLLEMSTSKCKASDLSYVGAKLLVLLDTLGLLQVKRTNEKDDDYVEFNNMTIINLAIKFCGPIKERNLSSLLLLFQVRYFVHCGHCVGCCSCSQPLLVIVLPYTVE